MSVFAVILVRIQSECRKLRTRITPNTDTFYAVVYFRKAEHACGMSKKGHILINLGQFEDEPPLNNMRI